jgi:aspartyl-tRNA synthetase
MHRTHTCGELRGSDAGKRAVLAGWLCNIRDKGAIMFFTLRDFYGLTQAVTEDEGIKDKIRSIPKESVIQVTGAIALRQDPNPEMETGEIEMKPEEVSVLGKCTEPLPFEIAASSGIREDLRLKYRFLDLRNAKVRANIELRSKVISAIRQKMAEMGFMEMQTPILTSSSPEGARDYIVPSRVHPGKFYALPQAPQQFKQLLMLSGFDKYFQIAPCFRDEDARADRAPGEFYQLDVEMAFAEQDDVFSAMESLMHGVFTQFSSFEVSKPPFRRIKYKDSIRLYGTDKPDLRIPLEIVDLTQTFANSGFAALSGKSVKALKVTGGSSAPRKLFDRLTEEMKGEGAKGLVWLKVSEGNTLAGSAAKFITPLETSGIIEKTQSQQNDALFIIADEENTAAKLCGILRNKLGIEFNLIKQNSFEFCWIVDFPMYELDDEGSLAFSHNPFSMPQGGMEALKTKNPLEVEAYQYDIVVNGVELSSGAVRNHSPELMLEAFRLAGYSQEVVETKFSALFNAFKFGAPPHAGIAPGIDRIVMLLANESSIREVIAFPMNKTAQDLLMNAPGTVTDKQLEEVHIQLKLPEEKK